MSSMTANLDSPQSESRRYMYILFLLTTCNYYQQCRKLGGGAKGKHFLSFPFAPSSPQLCTLHVKEGPARESVKSKKGHKSDDLREKEGHT